MRRALRWLNVAIALVTLASGLAVLGSDLLVTGYRELHRDALWFVVAYCAAQVLMVVEFARDGRLVPWLAVAKALAACLFFASFFTSGLYWMAWTPGRYVYQLFVWGEETKVGLFALAFLGRGTFNTLNAFYFTRPWWGPLRVRRPPLGRAVTVDQVRAALAYAAHVVSLERIVAVPRGREPAGGAAELLRAAGHDAVAVYHDACSQPPYATSSGLSGPPTIPTAHAIPPAK